jgi:hypothetical protein
MCHHTCSPTYTPHTPYNLVFKLCVPSRASSEPLWAWGAVWFLAVSQALWALISWSVKWMTVMTVAPLYRTVSSQAIKRCYCYVCSERLDHS